MKKIWILIVLFAFTGCQPDAQQDPVAPPVVVEKAVVQENPPLAAPEPQQTPVKSVAAVPNELPAQPGQEAGKPEVASAPQVEAAPLAEPAKAATSVVTEQVPAATPAPKGMLSEEAAMALAKKKNCFACHAMDKKMVGPAWRGVAQKYRGDAGAQAALEDKVRKGGKGVWGSIAMPPQPALSGEELTGLVQFVLQLK